MLGTISVSSHLQELLYRARNYLSLFTLTGAVISCFELSQSLHIYRICYVVLVTILVSSHLRICYIVLGSISVSSHLQELLYRARNYLILLTFTVAVKSC